MTTAPVSPCGISPRPLLVLFVPHSGPVGPLHLHHFQPPDGSGVPVGGILVSCSPARPSLERPRSGLMAQVLCRGPCVLWSLVIPSPPAPWVSGTPVGVVRSPLACGAFIRRLPLQPFGSRSCSRPPVPWPLGVPLTHNLGSRRFRLGGVYFLWSLHWPPLPVVAQGL